MKAIKTKIQNPYLKTSFYENAHICISEVFYMPFHKKGYIYLNIYATQEERLNNGLPIDKIKINIEPVARDDEISEYKEIKNPNYKEGGKEPKTIKTKKILDSWIGALSFDDIFDKDTEKIMKLFLGKKIKGANLYNIDLSSKIINDKK